MDQVLETIKRAHQGDKAARDRLVQENMPLVWSIVRRFSNRGYEPEDLFQIGSIGLLKAIDRFDTAYEVKFSTYAVPLIIGEIRRYLRDDGMLKVSRPLKETAWKVRTAEADWQNTVGEQICDRHNEIEERTDHLFLEQLLDTLEAKEQQLIYLRYVEEKTQSEVAKIMGTTQVQISRREKKLLAKLREKA